MKGAINHGEVLAAGALLLLALCFGVLATGYDLGTLRRMGPGAAPLAEAIILAISAAMALFGHLRVDRKAAPTGVASLLLSVAAIGAWAILVRPAGFLPATFVSVALLGLADRPFRPMRTLMVFGLVSLLGYLLFIKLLMAPLALIGSY